MAGLSTKQHLRSISTDQIFPNPENPRLIFRQEEMESLMLSIDSHGIQVPVTVFHDGDVYRLIDGERRWRCAQKLNLKVMPAIVQDRPSELENLVLMYNIHALREQWDYYTIASKLERVIQLFEREHTRGPTEAELSNLTGLTRGAIRRCRLIIDLPERFKEMLLEELERPKADQRYSEDFFIEMEKSLKSVTKRLPEYVPALEDIRDTLVAKFDSGIISAITDFRQLSKIATAVDTLGVAHRTAKKTLDRVFDATDRIGIREAYQETVEFGYAERRFQRQTTLLADFLLEMTEGDRVNELEAEFIDQLRRLYHLLGQVVG